MKQQGQKKDVSPFTLQIYLFHVHMFEKTLIIKIILKNQCCPASRSQFTDSHIEKIIFKLTLHAPS